MNKRWLLNGVLVVMMLFSGVIVAVTQDHEDPHWTYEGEEGPANWGELSPDWEACGVGQAQSPIDITEAQPVSLTDIDIAYSDSAINIFNNGHTIQVNYDEGSSITYNEIDYQLLQFHFHHPSEHTVGGIPAAMEIHFVHRSANGELAVIGVMLVVGDNTNDAYAPVFDHLPAEMGEPEALEDMSINAADLLPDGALFYTYNGSLTTPPCTEIVRWLVMVEPVVLSLEQVEAFGAIFELNARPVQPLNNRDLFVDTAG